MVNYVIKLGCGVKLTYRGTRARMGASQKQVRAKLHGIPYSSKLSHVGKCCFLWA